MIAYDEWKKLTLSQFWSKKILNGIIRSISEELQEVYDIQQQLRSLTNIDVQQGVNLDNIGDIVCVSREKAQEILLKDEQFEMTDDLYRNVLKFMIALHGSSATYYDIINGIRLIWDVDNVTYSEDRAHPASYTLDLGERDPDDDKTANSRTLTIRAAGVKARYLIRWLLRINHIYWKTRVALVEYKLTSAFFDSVRKIDGSLQLNGTYKLDAATQGKGCVDYALAVGWPTSNAKVDGVVVIPDRLFVTSKEIRITQDEAAVIGWQGNELTSNVTLSGLEIQTVDDLTVSNEADCTLMVGDSTKTVNANGYLISRQELYGKYRSDGIDIFYSAEAEFGIEMAKIKVY